MTVMEVIILSVFLPLALMVMMEPKEILSWYGRAIERLPLFLFKPLGGCPKCMSGQLALWIYLFYGQNYALGAHLTTVVVSIYGSYLITLIMAKYE